MIQNRGGAVIKQRGASSAQSAARAIVCHMRDWFLGIINCIDNRILN
jgi:malate dehydrogenase